MSGKRAEGDFQAEIEAHLRLEADRLMAEGMTPEEARAEARRAFGNVARAGERFYESQRRLWWEQLVQDLRYGLRTLRKTPAFTAAAALTIALGVGANTAVFSLVDAVLLEPLPVHNPKELVFLTTAGSAGPSGTPPYACFLRLRAEISSFSGLAAYAIDEMRIEIDGRPEQVVGQVASGNYFELLGVRPSIGRLLEAADEKPDAAVAVISDRYWRRRFGADPAVIGKTISSGNRTLVIAGVTAPDFFGLTPGSPIDVTIPIATAGRMIADREARWLHGIIARLKPGVRAVQAEAESSAVFRSFMADSRQPAELIQKHFNRVELRAAGQGADGLRRRFSQPLYALMGMVALVLLLAAANIANLLLARGIARRREFAIRLATGAGRGRLVRQLLTETLLLFGLGAVPGVLLAGWGTGFIETLLAQGRRPIALEADLNWRVLGFSILVTLAAGILAGLFPAWRALRTDPEQALREGRASKSRGSATLTRALVAFQVALSLVLLAGASTFLRTLANLRDVDTGFQNKHVLTMSVELPGSRPGAIWSQALEAVREIPGVRSAALCAYTPLSGRARTAEVRIRGWEPPPEDSPVYLNPVSEGYFETLNIPLVRGRPPTARDAAVIPAAALLNEAAARKYFGERDPIGHTLELGKEGAGGVYRIAGVVRDTKHRNLREASPPFVFVPIRQTGEAERRVTLAAAATTPGGETALLEPIRRRVAGVDPGLMISEVITLRGQLDSTLLTERLLSGLSSAFGALALILASTGLYGVLSYRIGQQRRSLGIRMALGASRSSVAFGVLRQSGIMVAAGLAGGLPFAFVAARTADSMLWGVTSSDPTTYISGAVVLCAAGFASAWAPARRASAIDPAEALRHE